ncbi:MAG: retroviral-like aspartic protease [Anaerolineales bacterium]|nr:retroviral-like aspartic protease [Anaerolineales bacterium]
MVIKAERFSYSESEASSSIAGSLPYLPLTLTYRGQTVEGLGLLDTGATVNVLPYQVGVSLGAVWEAQTTPVRLTGNLAQQEARVLIVSASVSKFSPTRLAFAWTKSDEIPLILGQVNFFIEFEVCFFRSQLAFELKPKQN